MCITFHLCTLPPDSASGISLTGLRYVEQGQPLRLTCNTSGQLGEPPTIDWFKDGDKIDSSNYRHVIITNYRETA